MLALGVEHGGDQPRYRQLYGQLRDAILAGRLAPGSRLPSSRGVARSLGVARNTVLAAVEQLAAEGYVAMRRGSGTYVASALPDAFAGPMPPTATTRGPTEASRPIPLAFVHSLPDVAAFPADHWGRLVARTWRRPGPALLTADDPLGHAPLRAAIADYLRIVRAVRADPGQILITSGAQHGLDLAARVLARRERSAWVEDPGYDGARLALVGAGARPVAVPVDAEGLSVAAGRRLGADAALAVVTPSHQFPLGTTMSLGRRLELIDWARAAKAWIVEDDYDSEYRFAGRPLAALQGLDASGRVVYVGTFAKVLFPSLRVGYLVAPPGLVDRFVAARRAIDGRPAIALQPALAAFIEGGAFASHVRRTRQIYSARRARLLDALARHLGGVLEPRPGDGGMHVVATFVAPDADDRAVAAAALAEGVAVKALSAHYVGTPRLRGLLIGHAAVPDDAIEPGVAALARAIATCGVGPARGPRVARARRARRTR